MHSNEDKPSIFFRGEEESSIDLQGLIAKYLYHWPLFLVTLFAFIGLAFIYLRYTQPKYSVNTTLLIKDDKKGSVAGGGDLLNELDLFGSSKVVDNEIEILKSKTLMRKVVDRISLSANIIAVGRVKATDIYSERPVFVDVISLDPSVFGSKFYITFPTSSTYQLENESRKIVVSGPLDSLQSNKLGVYRIKKVRNFVDAAKFPLIIHFEDPSAVADRYLGDLTVELASKQSSVLNLSIETDVPEKGKDVLNTLVQVYNEAALADKNRTTQSTMQFIDERLRLITGELTDVEKDVEGFKSSRGLTDISSDANLFLESVKTNDLKLNEIKLQISVIDDIERYVNANSPNEKLPSTFGINDPVLLGLVTQLGELQLQRDQLLSTTTESNPAVVPLMKQIETVRSSIKSSISNLANALSISRIKLESNNTKFQNSIKKIPGQERELISIKRQQSIKESLYLYLLQKKEESALSYASSVADSRIVDEAYYSKVPIKPKKQVILLSAFLMGIFVPALMIYLRGILNSRIDSLSAFEKISTVPVAGKIINNEEAIPLVINNDTRTAIAEQFRALRTNMQYFGSQPADQVGGKVTLFTSSSSGEGKTFVAINLAAALAISGKRTLVIELDLRKPKVLQYLSLEKSRSGISNYLIGQATSNEIIQNSGVYSNFDIIGAGPVPPNPSELLIKKELTELISELRTSYDEILIDCAPVGLVTDAQIVSKITDLTFYLVRENVTFKNQIESLEQLYKSGNFPNLNVIYNGMRQRGDSYGYSYGYGYYTQEPTSNRKISKFFKNILQRF
jgi:tyrosine-protein kinase Etk/Wzc